VRLRFLLRPSWLALTLAVFAFAAACYTILAPWQFGRNDEQQTQNTALRDSFGAPAVPLDRLVAAGAAPTGDLEWREVTSTGHYLPADEVMARLRTVEGEPAFEVLTPFRLTDGRIVLVDRGYQRPQAGTPVPEYPAAPTGELTLTARVRADEPADSHRVLVSDGRKQVYSVNAGTVGATTHLTISPGYLQLDPGQPGVVNALPLPQLDSGPFLSYALQWIAFGTMALFGWAYFSWREARPGGALDSTVTPSPQRESKARKRKSVAEILADDEAAEAETDTRSSAV